MILLDLTFLFVFFMVLLEGNLNLCCITSPLLPISDWRMPTIFPDKSK